MKNKKIRLIIGGIILSGILITAIAISSSSKETKVSDVNVINPIKEIVKNTLDSEYNIMTDWKTRNGDKFIENKELLALYNKENDFKAKLYEKVNLKIEDFKSDIEVEEVYKTNKDTYLAYVLYGNSFYEKRNSKTLSESRNEPYIFEIKNNNGSFTINKMIDMSDDLDLYEKSKSKTKITEEIFKDYDKRLEEESNNIDKFNKNIDKYAKEIISNGNKEININK